MKLKITLLIALLLACPAAAATFTVTTPADSGPGSLREAIAQVNARSGNDRIHFNIPGAGPHRIDLVTKLPRIAANFTTVDGTTQPGYAGTPRIMLWGAALPPRTATEPRGSGLEISSDGCLVQALAVAGFRAETEGTADSDSDGFLITGDSNTLFRCIAGLDFDGRSTRTGGLPAVNKTGIRITGGIGNVVDECTAQSIVVSGEANTVGACNVGYRPDGTAFPGDERLDISGEIRVVLDRESRVGEPGAGNRCQLISINESRGTLVRGNIVGRSADNVIGGFLSIEGISVGDSGHDVTVGGPGPEDGNIVFTSSRMSAGIQGRGRAQSVRNRLTNVPTTVLAGPRNLRIEGNTVSSAGAGIRFSGLQASAEGRVTILNNILRDCGTGIEFSCVSLNENGGGLGGFIPRTYPSRGGRCAGNIFDGTVGQPVKLDGLPLVNDPLDADTAEDVANAGQNHPVLTAINYHQPSGRTEIAGTLTSAPSRTYRIELLSAAGSGNRYAGCFVHGTQDVTTDGTGLAAFQFSLPGFYNGRRFFAFAADIAAGGLNSEASPSLAPASGTFTLQPAFLSLTENGGGTSAVVRVRRSGGSYGAATVQLALDGSTAPTTDFLFTPPGLIVFNEPPLLSFAHGETEKLVSVTAVDDTIYERTEVFALSVINPTGGAAAVDSYIPVIVTDNEEMPCASTPSSQSFSENAGTVNVPIQIFGAAGMPLTVRVVTENGSAVSPADFTAVDTNIVIPPGQTSTSFPLTIAASPSQEFSETLWISLTIQHSGSFCNIRVPVTITDTNGDPPGVTSFTFESADYSTAEGGFLGMSFITLRREGSLAGAASVRVRSAENGTAGSADFTALDQVVEFLDGEQFKTVTLMLAEDALDEPAESLSLTLTEPTHPGGAFLGARPNINITLTDDDDPPVITIGSTDVAEGSSDTPGFAIMNLPVTLSAPSGRPITLNYTGAGGYDSHMRSIGSVTIPAGSTTGSIPVEVWTDFLDEPNVTWAMPFSTTDGQAAIAGSLKIVDDDEPGTTFRLNGLPASVPESKGLMQVFLERGGNLADTETCTLQITDGGQDARLLEKVFTFIPGETSKVVTIEVIQDTLDEPLESVTVQLTATAPAITLPASGKYFFEIQDDDLPPELEMESPVTVMERDAGVATVTVRLRLSAPSGGLVTIQNVTTVAGTALAGSDFTAVAPHDVIFLPGEMEKTVALEIIGDYALESEEQFSLTTTGAIGATLLQTQSKIFITDNDTAQATYRTWLTAHFNPAERRTILTDPCGDADGDGLNNSLEFFLDSNPRSAASGPERLQITAPAGLMQYEFTGMASRAAFVQPVVEQSKTLADWTALNPGDLSITDSGVDSRRYKVVVTTAPTSRLFLRVRTACPDFEPDP